MSKYTKILGHKAYGSIGHLPSSRLGKGDHSVPQGQADICTVKTRDKYDRVIVQEKLDGSCTSVALIDGVIHALGRAGWPAISSRYLQHRLFSFWVSLNEDRFRSVLKEGERIVGEWLAQAHGTLYDLSNHPPWAAFDIMTGHKRVLFDEFQKRIRGIFSSPSLLHVGSSLSVQSAVDLHEMNKWPCDTIEGVVYRVERYKKVDFLAKWVMPDKVDGKYLPEISNKEIVWNWKPN